jgi:NAD(P)-dependent dehydrogenase (short-subunit alcohol dehydrogenase family)
MSDPLFDVSGRGVLMAGGAGGLGRVLARAFAERGARILSGDPNQEAAAALAGALPGEGHGATALDVTDETSCQAAVARCPESAGRLDVLINASGLFRTAPADRLPAEDMRKTLEVNVTGAFLIARAAAAAMAGTGGGRIVTLASVSSAVANPHYAACAASKAGLANLTRVLAIEWAARDITVNAIGPAMIATPLTEAYLEETGNRDYALGRIPMGRFGRPEDLVGTALLLASDAGAFITGQTIYVDGGRTCF